MTLTDSKFKLDIKQIQLDFPILSREVRNNRKLIYLDSAATSQKPRAVIDRMAAYYATENSNVHRGVHTLSQRATDAYEAGRELVQGFINARHAHEVIFTRGTTESINLVAATYGRSRVRAGDNIVSVSQLYGGTYNLFAHTLPQFGIEVRFVDADDPSALAAQVDDKTRLVFAESIGNPTLNVVDIKAWSDARSTT